MTTIYKKGDLIKKSSHELFKFNTPHSAPILCPYDTVRVIQQSRDKGSIYINGCRYDEPAVPIIISKSEAKELWERWRSIEKSEPSISKRTEFEHTREDNGEDKVGYTSLLRAKKVLWKYSQKFPDKKFELYTCSVCGEIHMGKTLEENDKEPNSREESSFIL